MKEILQILSNYLLIYLSFLTRLYLEEHLGNTVPITSFGAQSGAGCAAQDLHEEGSAALSAAPHYTCAANSMEPVTLEDHMAQLTCIDVGEM